jgi:hypothetical protein
MKKKYCTISEYNFAEFYAASFSDGRYVFSSATSPGYYYDDYNVLHPTGNKAPFKLKNEIRHNFDTYDRERPEQSNAKLLRMVGSLAFADSAILLFVRVLQQKQI